MAKLRKHHFGHPDDEVENFISDAEQEIKGANPKNKKAMRRASEWAPLALTSSLEKAVGEPITSDRTKQNAIGRIAKAVGNKKFASDFSNTDRMFHSACFHQSKCDRDELLVNIGVAKSLISQVIATKGKLK